MGNMITPYTPPTDAGVDSTSKSAPAEPQSYANEIAGSKKARQARANFERQVQQDGMGGATPLAAPLEASKTLMGSAVNPYALTPKQLRAVREDPKAPPMLPPPGAHVKLPSAQQAAEFVRHVAQARVPKANAANSTLQNKAMTPALGVGAAGAGAAGATGSANGAAEPAAPQAAVPDATDHAAATPSAGNSHGSSHAGFGHPVTKATLAEDYAALCKASEPIDPNAPVSWARFFNLLALKNSGLIHEFALLKAQEEHLANSVSVDSLKLSRDYTETNQDFDRLAALAAFAQSVAQMRNDASMGPTRGMTTSNKFLNPQELDLRSGLENAQMQGPVQDVYRRNFIHEVAGDKDYAGVPLLNDPTGEVSKQIHKPDPSQTTEQYKELNEKKKDSSAVKDSHIMVSFTYTDAQGQKVEQKLQRTLLTEKEIAGLGEPNQSSYRSIIARDLDVKRSEDWGGRLGLIENEINILKSAAGKIPNLDTENHPELAAKQAQNEIARGQLMNRAAELEPQRESAQKVMQEAANIAASSEGRFGDLVKNRAVMEEERLRAMKNVEMLEANASGVDRQGKPISSEDQADAVKKLPVYNQLVANLNYRCLSLDQQLTRFIDPQSKSIGPTQGQEVGENRRARWHTGSQSLVQYYRDYKLGTRAEDPVAAKAFNARTVPYIRNTVAISEHLNELLLANPGKDSLVHVEIMRKFIADRKEGVTATRMIHHLKDRAMALAENEPERKLLTEAEKFWKDSGLLTSAGNKEFIPSRSVADKKADLLASPAQWAGQKLDAGRMTWTLRQQRPKGQSTSPSGAASESNTGTAAAPTATPPGSHLLATEVDYTDPKAVANYHDIQAKAGAAIFGNLSTGKRTGAYKDATYERYERTASVLRTYAMNASNANVLNSDADAAIQGVSGDIKEASNEFASLLARAYSETNGLVKRMLEKANASFIR